MKTFSGRGGDTPPTVPSILGNVVSHRGLEEFPGAGPGLPIQQGAHFGYVRNAAVGIVVAFPVELFAGHTDDIGEPDRRVAELLSVDLPHRFRHLANGDLVRWRTNVENLPVAHRSEEHTSEL